MNNDTVGSGIENGGLVFEKRSPNIMKSSAEIRGNQEKTRSNLALGFSAGYGMLIFMFVYIIVCVDLNQANANLLTVLLSGTTGFVGTILGFYFGQNSK